MVGVDADDEVIGTSVVIVVVTDTATAVGGGGGVAIVAATVAANACECVGVSCQNRQCSCFY